MFHRNFVASLLLLAVPAFAGPSAPATAPTDRDAIAAEIKIDEDAVQTITAELKQDEKDAADAEGLANNPPADLKGDKKTAYIDEKKNEAQTAHDAAKDAHERLDEAKKSLEEAKARLAPTTTKSPKI